MAPTEVQAILVKGPSTDINKNQTCRPVSGSSVARLRSVVNEGCSWRLEVKLAVVVSILQMFPWLDARL